MQPYFFPYIGYWQLLNAVDKFVIYDDVNFIKGGWINRNRILVNGEPKYFTAPVSGQSSNKAISDLFLQESNYWRGKLLRMLEVSYGTAPHFEEVFPLLKDILESKEQGLSSFIQISISRVVDWLGIKTDLVVSSKTYSNSRLRGQERVLDICAIEHADTYLNLPGGRSLYNRNTFQGRSIDLKFLCPRDIRYQQFGNNFVPDLSIIDVLMFNPRRRVIDLLTEWEHCQ